MLEIGVGSGASLHMWREYFPNAKIYGIDNNPDCAKNAENVFIGNQIDASFLLDVRKKIGTPDIIIDDGGHIGAETIETFKLLFPTVAKGGYYIVEDTHCFYHPLYSGENVNGGKTAVYNFLTDLAHHVDVAGRAMTGDAERALNSTSDPKPVPKYSAMLEAMHIHPSIWFFERR